MDPRLDPRRELYLPAAFDGAYVLPDGRYGQAVKHVAEGAPQLDAVAALALVEEACVRDDPSAAFWSGFDKSHFSDFM